ncbi:methyltransferase domain-containing protein [Rhizobium puerariae]|uniref:Methyltransferase domain-containing protein n=1 Tax=Rhizobium puerariae TaxID=1585791 RepID=A0ABV6ACA8_9HYPH
MKTLSPQDYYGSVVAALKQKNVLPGGEAMMEAILAVLPEGAGRIIDLGCHTGWVTRQLARAFPQAEVIGVDHDPAVIEVAREAARLEASGAMFACAEGASIEAAACDADVVVCGGSAAFFKRPEDVYRTVAGCLKPGGLLVDCHYVYDADVPPALRQKEREVFGLGWMPDGLRDIVAVYDAAGLTVTAIRRLPQFHFDDSAAARLARDILHAVPKMQELVEAMAERRELIGALASHRHPYLLVAGIGKPATAEGTAERDIANAIAALDLFSMPIARQPVETLRGHTPHRFRAYVGNPDGLPGGGRAVGALARSLQTCGAAPDARVLDIGCFTGLSTVVLANYFSDVTGLDIDEEFIDVASCVGNALASGARFVVGDGAGTGFASGHFDAVTMTAISLSVRRPMALLAETRRILKPDGLLAEFIHHHDRERPQESDGATTGADDVRMSLSRRLAVFEKAGFDLVDLSIVDTGATSPTEQAALRDYVRHREHMLDPSKTRADLQEFSELFTRYGGQWSGEIAKSIAYLCVFMKRRHGGSW